MILTIDAQLRSAELGAIKETLIAAGYAVSEVRTTQTHREGAERRCYLVAQGKDEDDIRRYGALPGVLDVHRVSDPFPLVSRKWRVQPTRIDVHAQAASAEQQRVAEVGEGELTLIAGPCSLETEEQMQACVEHLSRVGVRLMRAGAFKPRTSPYSFRGLGVAGLRLCHEIAQRCGIGLVAEVTDASQIEAMMEFVSVFQVGARNSQNFTLLHELGQVDKPVLLKRGVSGSVDELLHSAEYILSNGNEQIILCERGIRTFETRYRNTLDLNAVAFLKERSHLPVFVDPSHGVGVRRLVPTLAMAAVMAGADGILLEVAPIPELAASDGAQTLNFAEAERLYPMLEKVFQTRRELERAPQAML